MRKVVKMCDMPASVAMSVFEQLNRQVKVKNRDCWELRCIVTDAEPNELVYPEGWYYAKGCFRNKHTSTNGRYEEVKMVTSTGKEWEKLAIYCTLDDE